MERGRKMLGALRRGRTSARADSPARTRFARVRRATQRGLLVTAHGELRPVALIILSPAALSPVHVSLCLLLAVARSPSSAFSSSPRPGHANRARRRPPGHSGGPLRSALHQHAARVTPRSVQRGSPMAHQQAPVHGAVSFLAVDAAGNVRGPG